MLTTFKIELTDNDAYFDRFDICSAYALMESDWNIGGILQERETNQRNNRSTGVQLHRMDYRNPYLSYDNLTDNAKVIYALLHKRYNFSIECSILDELYG